MRVYVCLQNLAHVQSQSTINAHALWFTSPALLQLLAQRQAWVDLSSWTGLATATDGQPSLVHTVRTSNFFLTICKETHASINLSLPPQPTKGSLDSPTRSLRQLYYWLANWLSACFRRVGQPLWVSCFLTHRRDTASNISARLLLQLLAVSFSLFVPGSSHRWSFVQLYRTLRSLPESRFLILLVPARTKQDSFPSDRPNGTNSRSHCSRYCCQPHPSKLYTFGAGTQVALLSLSIGKTILNRMLQKPIL